jgi:hypothetical protein
VRYPEIRRSDVLEALVAALLAVVCAALAVLGPERLLQVGGVLAATGLLGSLPVGLAYHFRLRAWLARRGPPPRRWWWAPSRFHAGLERDGRASVLPFFTAGVVLIGLCAIGLLFVGTGTVKAYMAVGQTGEGSPPSAASH